MRPLKTGELGIRRRDKDQASHAKESFITESLARDQGLHKEEVVRFEKELTALTPHISYEQARHLYEIQTALHELHRRSTEESLVISKEQLGILLSLGHDLLGILSRQGVVPAIMKMRGKEESGYRVLTQPPIELFGPSVLEEYFFEGEYSEKNIIHALEFAHDVHQWNTNYYRTHRNVGTIPREKVFEVLDKFHIDRPGKGIAEEDVRNAFRTREDVPVMDANYLVMWRSVPFVLFKMLIDAQTLDVLPVKSRSFQISRMMKKSIDEIIGPRDYYNRMILEEPPRVLQALAVLYALKGNYAMRPTEDQSIRDKIHKRFYELINSSKFKFYYDEDSRKDFRELVGVREGEYEFE